MKILMIFLIVFNYVSAESNWTNLIAELTCSEKLLFDGYITKLKAHLSQGLMSNCDWSGEKSLVFIKESIALLESVRFFSWSIFNLVSLKKQLLLVHAIV